MTTTAIRNLVPGQNHRTYFDPEEMRELEEGVRAANGLIQSVLVRPLDDGRFEIIAGERRVIAARNVYGPDFEVPILIRPCSDAEAAALGLIENIKRHTPSIPEQARGAATVLALNQGDKRETARVLGWSTDMLDRRLLLLHCADEVLDALIHRRIQSGHAELLAGVPQDRQRKVLEGVIAHKASVEVLKKQLGQFARRLSDAIFDTAPCANCIHNSAQQSGLFDASLGEGYCQHPTHFEELTMAVLEQRAQPLRDQYQVVRIVRPGDGFTPLHVHADGELGVGAEQYSACQGCASFGCSLSAIPGAYGQQDDSLCFDAACHTNKVADRRRAEREAERAARAEKLQGLAQTADAQGATPALTDPDKTKPAAKAGNHTPPRVAQYRVEKWRAWAAEALMADPGRNHRVLAALVLASETRAIHPGPYLKALDTITEGKAGPNTFRGALEQCAEFDAATLPAIVNAVAASAAYGIDPAGLETLLNYLEVDEAAHFRLDANYLELLTVSELEGLADELKLKKAMGAAAFKKARAGKKSDFITALLAVEGVRYEGLVPRAMRYARKKLKPATRPEPAVPSLESDTGKGKPTKRSTERAPEPALAD